MEGDGVAQLREKHPAWEISVYAGKYHARWVKSSPPICAAALTAAKLAEQITAAESAWYATYSWRAVNEAIEKA